MIGYWRAYAPVGLDGPTPQLLGDGVLEFGPQIEEIMRGALDRSDRDGGKVWLPEPLALGSSLPSQMETWLRQHAINVENRWFSSSSRLTAWASPAQVDWQGLNVTFGPLGLAGAGVGRGLDAVASNSVLPIGLAWSAPIPEDDLSVSLRLVDADGQIWARREYAPPGEFAGTGRNGVLTETIGLIIPTGAPPGDYTLAAAISTGADALPLAASGEALHAFAAGAAGQRAGRTAGRSTCSRPPRYDPSQAPPG